MDPVPDLFDAIRTGDVAKVRDVLSADAALVDARNAQGQSAVLMACYMGAERNTRFAIGKRRDIAVT